MLRDRLRIEIALEENELERDMYIASPPITVRSSEINLIDYRKRDICTFTCTNFVSLFFLVKCVTCLRFREIIFTIERLYTVDF